jgi:hypothetical protein
MQNRIDRLEGLVLSLMTNGAQSAGPAAAAAAISRSQSDSAGSSSFPLDLDREDDDMIKEEEEEGEDSEVDGVTSSLGILKVDADKGKSLYFGDSHWHLVLADVSNPIYFLLFHHFFALKRTAFEKMSLLALLHWLSGCVRCQERRVCQVFKRIHYHLLIRCYYCSNQIVLHIFATGGHISSEWFCY